jgi:hypothetical protein
MSPLCVFALFFPRRFSDFYYSFCMEEVPCSR